MYGEVVDGIDGHLFEEALSALKEARGVDRRHRPDARTTCASSSRPSRGSTSTSLGREFPQDARSQLRAAVEAVFRSWQNPRAQVYRQLNDIPETIGTAVNVVQMVFGNAGERSATGVAFSRDPATGEKVPHGEFLFDAQGEDVVAGIRAPQPLEQLEQVLPGAYAEFQTAHGDARAPLPRRPGRRVHGRAGTAVHPADPLGEADGRGGAPDRASRWSREGLISREEAVLRIEPVGASTTCCTR